MILGPESAPLSRSIDDYPEGIIIPIDKPYRWTSADVIRKVKFAAIRHFGKKNLKVGHAGTLDPLATGVLLVCIGKATKLAEELQSHDKEYVAGITFGATTPSYDLEKEIDRFFPHEHITAETVAEALPAFIGEQDQIAPLFSAKSVDGVRAYELARKLYKSDGSLDEAARELIRVSCIRITELELLEFHRSCCNGTAEDSATPLAGGEHELSAKSPADFCCGQCGSVSSTEGTLPASTEDALAVSTEGAFAASTEDALPASTEDALAASTASSRINVTDNSALGLPRAVVRMACSKGTYVRAFARDLGEALGTGAHLDALLRSRSGIFRSENALSVEQTLSLLAKPQKAGA